jgi:hypothetical protein
MKIIFLILILGIMAITVNAVQPARKPFLQLKIDGKSIKNGDIITVTSGQKLTIVAEMEGGRRDFCKFPDTYSDLAGTAQILSRGDHGLTYSLNGVRAEWILQSEEFIFSSDENVKIKSSTAKNTAEIIISEAKFSQSFVKISGKTIWQFSQEENTSQEENLANGTIYLKIAGSSDEWYSSKNIHASGIRNDMVQEKMELVQSACDSIVQNFHHLNFAGVQQSIRGLQASVNTLKLAIDEVKVDNPSYHTQVHFIGLPSDDPFSDIEVFNSIKTNWAGLESLVSELKAKSSLLPAQPANESQNELLLMIGQYADWYSKIPENSFKTLISYIPDFDTEKVGLPQHLVSAVSGKTIRDYPQILTDFNTFLNGRSEQLPNEIQRINSTHSRMQAIRLFDGMLRSYFSSIAWADWESTRGF